MHEDLHFSRSGNKQIFGQFGRISWRQHCTFAVFSRVAPRSSGTQPRRLPGLAWDTARVRLAESPPFLWPGMAVSLWLVRGGGGRLWLASEVSGSVLNCATVQKTTNEVWESANGSVSDRPICGAYSGCLHWAQQYCLTPVFAKMNREQDQPIKWNFQEGLVTSIAPLAASRNWDLFRVPGFGNRFGPSQFQASVLRSVPWQQELEVVCQDDWLR